jgi:hypothetical protein
LSAGWGLDHDRWVKGTLIDDFRIPIRNGIVRVTSAPLHIPVGPNDFRPAGPVREILPRKAGVLDALELHRIGGTGVSHIAEPLVGKPAITVRQV